MMDMFHTFEKCRIMGALYPHSSHKVEKGKCIAH